MNFVAIVVRNQSHSISLLYLLPTDMVDVVILIV